MRFGNMFVSLLDQMSWKSFHQIIEAGTRMTENDLGQELHKIYYMQRY